MRLTVARRYRFEATHQLDGAATPWNLRHGHLYTVEVAVSADSVDDDGMVVDTDALDGVWAVCRRDYEGQHLNDTHSFPTTVENLAADLAQRFRVVAPQGAGLAVTVWEDDNRWGRAEG